MVGLDYGISRETSLTGLKVYVWRNTHTETYTLRERQKHTERHTETCKLRGTHTLRDTHSERHTHTERDTHTS